MTTTKKETSLAVRFLDDHRGTLSATLPRALKYDSFELSAHIAIDESADIQSALCHSAASAASVRDAMLKAASVGLSLNPAFQYAGIHCYYSKTKKEWKASYQAYKDGLIKKALESGRVVALICDMVCEGDTFSGVVKSLDGDEVQHVIARKDRGEVDGYYAAMKLDTGEKYATYMTRDQVWNHAEKYASSVKPGSAWDVSFDGMGKKTVLKSLLRGVRISDDVHEILVGDDREEYASPELVSGAATVSQKGTAAAELSDQIAPEQKQDPAPPANRSGDVL